MSAEVNILWQDLFFEARDCSHHCLRKIDLRKVGLTNGKSATLRDTEMAFLKSEPDTFESNE